MSGKYILGLLIALPLMAILPSTAAAVTCTAANGNWSAVGTWSCGHVPLASDDVVIPNTNGVNVTVDTAAVALSTTFTAGNRANLITISGSNSLTITNAITIGAPSGAVTKGISVGAGTLTAGSMAINGGTASNRIASVTATTGIINVSGNITFSGTASAARLAFSGAGTLNIGGANSLGTGGTFTASTGTVNFNGNGNQIIGPYAYSDLTTSGSGTKTTSAATTISDVLTVNAGTEFATGITNTWTLTVSSSTNVSGTLTLANTGNKTFTGNVTLNAGSVWNETGTGAVTFNADLVNNATTFTANTGTHTFGGVGHSISGGTSTAIPGTAAFTGTYTNSGTFSTATLSALAGASLTNNGTVTVSTALSGTGSFVQGAAGTLNFSGSTVAITTFSANTAGNTVNYAGATQTVRAVAYSNLVLSGSNAKSMGAGTSVAGNLSIAPTGTAQASIAAGQNLSVNTLTLGGVGVASGTWGSTASAATNTNNTYFAATTGILTVTNDGRLPQATLVANANPSTVAVGSTSTLSTTGGSGTGAVTFSVGASTGCTVLGTTLTATDSAGTCSVTATKAGDTTYQPATSAPLAITIIATPTHQLFLTAPGTMTAGTRLSFTVTRKDQYGNLKTSGNEIYYPYTYSTGTAARFYDAAVAGNIITTVTIANGTSSAQFWYYDELAGTHNIAVSDATPPDGATGIIDATSTATVTAAAATQFNITQNTTMTAGTRLAYTVTRQDQFGNLSSSGSNTVYLTSNSAGAAKKFYDAASGGNIITSVTLGSGTTSGNFWYYDELATNATVYASDNPAGPDGNAGIIDGTNAITILPASTRTFLLDNATGTMQVGTRFQYVVSRFDSFGNTVTAGSNTVYLQSNSTGAKAFYNAASGGSVITSVAIGAGSPNATFWYYDDAAGTWTVTGYDNIAGPDGATGIVDATSSITVSPAPIVATRFTIVKPADNVVGATVPVTIRAENNAGNLDTTYNNSVTLVTSGHATPQNGTVVVITNGLGSVNITDTFAETVTLSLVDSATTTLDVSSTQTVTFSPGATYQYIVNTPGNMTAGTRLGYTVTRKDQFGNLVMSGIETVHLYSSATGGLSAFYDVSSGGTPVASVSIASSTSVANFWYYEGKAGTWTITASDNATAPDSAGIVDGTRSVVVSPAATSQFSLNHPGDMTAGTRLGYTVTRKDQFGNTATSGSDMVYLYASPVSATSKFYSAASGGSVITSRTISAGVSTANFWYYDESTGSKTVTVSDNSSSPDGATGIADASDMFTVTAAPIVATRLTIVKPADVQTGTNTAVTIRAEDASGNIDTTFASSVTLVTSGSATGGGVVNFTNGVGTKTITDAVAETVTLTLLDTASTSLDVSSSQTVIFSTTPPAPASTPSAIGGTTAVTRSTVIFAGKVFPGAKLTIVAVGDGDIPVRQGTVAAGDGSFSIRFNGMAAGIRSFFLSVTDQNGKSSQTKTYSVDVNQSLVVRNVLLPPTINFAQQTVTKGGFVGITGYATPGFAVQATIDGIDTGAINIADNLGRYSIPINTFNLAFGTHTARTHQTSTEGATSDASIEGVFMVSALFNTQTDLNHDGKVDSTDLSIFLSRWNSTDPATRATVDFNGDGKLDVQDLSIFSRTLNK